MTNSVGENSEVSPRAEVSESVLWRNVRIDEGAVVRRAVLGDGVRIRSGERVENAVVVRLEIVREMERGQRQGDNLVVPLEPVLD